MTKKSLWTHIETGRSFVDSSSRSSPWQFPSDPHGTQMANLVCAIDPSCKLYVARVAEDAFGITAERVAKVSRTNFLTRMVKPTTTQQRLRVFSAHPLAIWLTTASSPSPEKGDQVG